MDVTTSTEGSKATIKLKGKLTVSTAPELSSAIEGFPKEICDFDIDISEVDYIASAGLRILVAIERLAAQRGGTAKLLHPTRLVMDIFEMTGLSEVLTIVS